MKNILFLTILALPFLAHAEEQKPVEVEAYEQCVVRVLSVSDKVSDVRKECEAEMDAFVALHDERVQKEVRRRADVLMQKHVVKENRNKLRRKSESE